MNHKNSHSLWEKARMRALGLATAALLVGALASCSSTADVPRGGPQLPSYPFGTGSDSPSPSPSALALGSPAPEFSLPGIDGQTISLATFQGQPVLLELFATWCPHCQRMAPIMEQLLQSDGSRGLNIIGVSASATGIDHQTPETLDDVRDFAQKFKVTYPLLFDQTLAESKAYIVQAYPTLYLLDKSLDIAWTANGEVALATLQQEVARVL
jgi:peroxiredoxin